MTNPETNSPDFLLSSCLFQKQAAQLFTTAQGSSPLAAYFSSLWLQEHPDDVSAGLTKKIQFTVCPQCGVSRDAENFSVRVKSRKKYSKAVAKGINKSKRRSDVGEISAEHLDAFFRARNRINIQCRNCWKSSSTAGVGRGEQKERLAAAKNVFSNASSKNFEVSTSAKAQKFGVAAGKTPVFLPRSTSNSMKYSPITSSGKKKRKKESNAGLRIPLLTSKLTSPIKKPEKSKNAENSEKPKKSTGFFSSPRPAQSSSQSALQKFLL